MKKYFHWLRRRSVNNWLIALMKTQKKNQNLLVWQHRTRRMKISFNENFIFPAAFFNPLQSSPRFFSIMSFKWMQSNGARWKYNYEGFFRLFVHTQHDEGSLGNVIRPLFRNSCQYQQMTFKWATWKLENRSSWIWWNCHNSYDELSRAAGTWWMFRIFNWKLALSLSRSS